MTMCRRLILTILTSITPSQSILVLSLSCFSTMLIAVNGIWNKPYRIHVRVLPAIECLYAVFLFMLQIIVINVKSVDHGVWGVLSWIAFGVVLVVIGMCLWLAIEETIKVVKINIWKYKKSKMTNTDTNTNTNNSNDNKTIT